MGHCTPCSERRQDVGFCNPAWSIGETSLFHALTCPGGFWKCIDCYPGHVSAGDRRKNFRFARNGKECDQWLWGRFVLHRRSAWLWFYGSLRHAVTAKSRPHQLPPPKLAARMKPWAARKMRSALPVSAVALHLAVKAKGNASCRAASLRASTRVAAAVAMVALSKFFVPLAHRANTHPLPQMRWGRVRDLAPRR
jgi:hypothetical protein